MTHRTASGLRTWLRPLFPAARFAFTMIACASFAIAGCSQPGTVDPEGVAADVQQTAFRVRTDFDAPLNADHGWGGAVNETATIAVEEPFRLRFELVGSGNDARSRLYRLQYRRNGGNWQDVPVAEFPYSEVEELTPRVSIVSTPAYANGADTSDVLDSAREAFGGGAGIAYPATPPLAPHVDGQTEWEWALVVRRYVDGAVTNDTGDLFEFRLADKRGRPVAASRYAALTVRVPPGLLGGTFVETPGRIGPWQAGNGDLYFLMEPAESYNVLMTVKSDDGGATWREVDGSNRPATGDLEGFASALEGDTIHMLHQVSEKVVYHAFRTSDHATQPDTWAVRDELVAEPPGEPPVQAASISVRSDGSLVAVYAGPEKIRVRTRSPAGTWGTETIVDADASRNLSGPQTVTGPGDHVHLAYTGSDGTAWYRRILADGSLTPRVKVAADLGTTEADSGSILPLVLLPGTNTVAVIYRSGSGELRERRVLDDGSLTDAATVTQRKVVQNAVDSDQAGADAIADGSVIHVLFIEQGSGNIFHTDSGANGSWSEPALLVDGINGQWIRGAPVTFGDGIPRYGFVYDAGSDGGSGPIWYADLPLDGD